MTGAERPAAPSRAAVEALADVQGVCGRPVVARVTDNETGATQLVPIPCGSTRESVCKACAERARRLRAHQCREGWHLAAEPEASTGPADAGAEGESPDEDDAGDRRVRSTRRRQDVPDLPRRPMEDRTVGRVFESPAGRVYRPSMFLTLTLPSYGKVDGGGVPVDPATYDYRRAALDAMHFAKLVDRFWQNLRRCAGYQVQYFASVEGQRRGAPHLHAAVRGAIPRQVIRDVVAATYHQVWWPPQDVPSCGEVVWVDDLGELEPTMVGEGGYVEAATGWVLPTWDEALDDVDGDFSPDVEAAHVVRFGTQLDIQGLIAGTPATDRAVGYLTKYLTKDLGAALGDDLDPENERAAAREAHLDRLAEETRWLPCSPMCTNWLRYGTQPKGARPGMVAGQCPGNAHRRANLGVGGRRVLVSRRWTGKTLTEHRADRAAVVRAALEEAGIDPDDHDELSVSGTDGRCTWETIARAQVDDATYLAAVAALVRTRDRWRQQYDEAKARAPDTSGVSATSGGP
jgi:hypothetical protein